MEQHEESLSSQGLGEAPEVILPSQVVGSFVQKAWSRLVQFGLGDAALRIGIIVVSLFFFWGIATLMGNYYTSKLGAAAASIGRVSPNNATPDLNYLEMLPVYQGLEAADGITREAALHTILPSRGRTALTNYVIQSGDTLFSIAEKFGLRPETILWGNRYTIGDDPHMIYPGQNLYILPVDGVLHQWSAGEGLNGVSSYFGVTPDAIIDYPPNGLNRASLGDLAHPNIPSGTLLIVPGGKADFPDWRLPRITREEPALARNVGPGACTEAYDGVLGTENFTWPVEKPLLSGYDFDPAANHFALDLAGDEGDPVMAADNGVVVYAGWNDWGYGEMVVIDHGHGWQTLYAHLSTIDVSCGEEVYRGDNIGTVGNTGTSYGAHLHFEMRHDEYGRVNPWDFLH
jgi:hypothetical protein